jgi:hypothetical protein
VNYEYTLTESPEDPSNSKCRMIYRLEANGEKALKNFQMILNIKES